MDGFRGMSFFSMSDKYLLQIFDELCELTADSRPNHEDWLDEWAACKGELLGRLSRERVDR